MKIRKNQFLRVVVIGMSVISLCTGCGKKKFWEYEASWVSDNPSICIVNSEGFDYVLLEIDGIQYELKTAHANDGSGITMYDLNINGAYTKDAIIWDCSCKIEDEKLYLTIEKDNISNFEGETIILHQELEMNTE